MEDARRSAVEALEADLARYQKEIAELESKIAELEAKKQIAQSIETALTRLKGGEPIRVIREGQIVSKKDDVKIIADYVREKGGSVKVTKAVTLKDLEKRGALARFGEGDRFRQLTILIRSNAKARDGIFHYDPATKILTLRS